ncbi:MAG: hypothetical protein QOJ72_1684 [Nocardioidaceae bacterium]|nr:hypothetical protein [Nocardioidaceae bacterium]
MKAAYVGVADDDRGGRVTKMVAIAVLTLLSVGACGSGDGGGSSDSPDSPRASAVSGGKAASYILAEDELPDGWRHASGEQFLGIPKTCGVTLEPPSLASVETRRFTKSFSGPFVIQYSFVSSDTGATTKRINEFVAAIKTCKTSRPAKGVTVAVSEITDVTPVGDAFGAVHEKDVDDPTHNQDIVAFRKGAVVTVLQSYSPGTLADHDALSKMAAAIVAKQP